MKLLLCNNFFLATHVQTAYELLKSNTETVQNSFTKHVPYIQNLMKTNLVYNKNML